MTEEKRKTETKNEETSSKSNGKLKNTIAEAKQFPPADKNLMRKEFLEKPEEDKKE